jgi:hypothetical protein
MHTTTRASTQDSREFTTEKFSDHDRIEPGLRPRVEHRGDIDRRHRRWLDQAARMLKSGQTFRIAWVIVSDLLDGESSHCTVSLRSIATKGVAPLATVKRAVAHLAADGLIERDGKMIALLFEEDQIELAGAAQDGPGDDHLVHPAQDDPLPLSAGAAVDGRAQDDPKMPASAPESVDLIE